MKTFSYILLILFSLTSFSIDEELKVVSFVDLNRYLGLWYEIARLPNRFQKHCGRSTAQYNLLDNGQIEVMNKCVLLSDDTKMDEAHGLARVVDKNTNAKLEVTFLPNWLRWIGIGYGDYWIVDLDENYRYSIVSEPQKKYLWILSRTPKIEPDLYDKILDKLRALGFDTSKLLIF